MEDRGAQDGRTGGVALTVAAVVIGRNEGARLKACLASLQGEGMMATLSLVGAMQPTTCDDDWPDRAREVAERPETDPLVRNTLLTAADTMGRVIRARA